MVVKTDYRLMQFKESILQYLQPFFKLQFVFKTFVLSIFEWLHKTGFTVFSIGNRFTLRCLKYHCLLVSFMCINHSCFHLLIYPLLMTGQANPCILNYKVSLNDKATTIVKESDYSPTIALLMNCKRI